MNKIFVIYLWIWTVLITKTRSARILAIMPAPSYSHHQVFIPVFKELARRGHELVLLTTHPINDSNLTNLREISWAKYNTLATHSSIKEVYMETSLCGYAQVTRFIKIIDEINTLQLEDANVQALINNKTEHFDLIMVEILNPVMFAFQHRFNAPIIGVVSMDLFNVQHNNLGNPDNSVLYPDRFIIFQGDMPILCRLISYAVNLYVYTFHGYYTAETNQNIKKYFGDNSPVLAQLDLKFDMMFMSANPAFFHPRPVTQATVNVYGLHIKKTKPLPEDLKKYFDESKSGVIYFSLGTNMNDQFMSSGLLALIKNVFRELPYDILWKLKNDTLEDRPKNVLIKKWIPQQDVLAHPKVKLFITQCGLQSLEEALYHQVPMLGLPIMCDQWINCNYLPKRGFGLALDYRTLKYEEFRNAILSIIQNSTRYTNF